MKFISLVILLFLNIPNLNGALVEKTFYPYGKTNGDRMGCPNDDMPYGPITVSSGFPFFGQKFNQIYISVNGAVSNEPMKSFKPERFPFDKTVTQATMCRDVHGGEEFCWMNNYYATEAEWQSWFYVQGDTDPCRYGETFKANYGIGDYPYVTRSINYAYVDTNCIYFTRTVNWLPKWMIAVYWHDIDIRFGNGRFYYREVNTTTDTKGVLQKAKEDIAKMKKGTPFTPTKAFVITWMNVTFFGGYLKGFTPDCKSQGFSDDCTTPEKWVENSIQLVVATDSVRSYGIYNYGDLNWGGGQVGFDAGDGKHFCSLQGSRSKKIIDIAHRSNIGVEGRWVMALSDTEYDDSMCEPHASLPTCVCEEGYEGMMCGKEVDECAVSPCPGNSVCTDKLNNYTCECTPGYIGANCDQKDPCYGITCQQNGTCQASGASYICTCSHPSHYGTHCENTNLCYGVTCLNGGTCRNGLCDCAHGFAGATCDKRDYCQGVKCGNSGTCVNNIPGQTYYCNCTAEWTGSNCTTVNYCHNHQCLNGATCMNGAKNYTCNCLPNYLGNKCQTQDYCYGVTCHNGATCNNGASNFNCQCTSGWIGNICNIPDYCVKSQCQNGAICENDVNNGGYICHCTAGWLGVICNTTDYCHGNSCQNGATCQNQASNYTCLCDPSYYGNLCQHFNSCYAVPCKNNGLCTDTSDDYTCQCLRGWLGTNCTVDDYCSKGTIDKNCSTHGTCINGNAGYTCSCNNGWNGSHCEVCADGYYGNNCEQYDYCNRTPVKCNAQNTAKCVNSLSGYDCNCTSGWVGTYCQYADACSSNPCQNGGSCVPIDSSFVCDCPKGYNTTTCAVKDIMYEKNLTDFNSQVAALDSIPASTVISISAAFGGLALLGLLACVIFGAVARRRKKKKEEEKEEMQRIALENDPKPKHMQRTKHGTTNAFSQPRINESKLTDLSEPAKWQSWF